MFTHWIFREVLGEESGLDLSLAVPACKGELKMPDSRGSQSSLTRALHRVPSKSAVLVQLAYNNLSPHIITAKRSVPRSPIRSGGRWPSAGLAGLFQRASLSPKDDREWMRGRTELPFWVYIP